MPDKEWYTLQELADQLGISYQKVRYAVDALSNIKAITTRPRPGDNRTLEVHRDSIGLVKQAAGA